MGGGRGHGHGGGRGHGPPPFAGVWWNPARGHGGRRGHGWRWWGCDGNAAHRRCPFAAAQPEAPAANGNEQSAGADADVNATPNATATGDVPFDFQNVSATGAQFLRQVGESVAEALSHIGTKGQRLPWTVKIVVMQELMSMWTWSMTDDERM